MRRRNIRRSTKVDLNDTDKKAVENMISSYKQKRNIEVPLRINEKLIILVSPENCNEHYRQKYLKSHFNLERS